MASDISAETPANTYKDLLHINNNGAGLDGTPKNIYAGGGVATTVNISTTQVYGDAGDGVWENVILQDHKTKHLDKGSVGDATANPTEIDLSLASSVKITLTDNISAISLLNAPATNDHYELTIISVQGSGPFTITWPTSVKWPGAVAPTLSSASGRADIFRMFTVDQGTTWIAWTVGQDYAI